MNNLAHCYQETGQLDEAISLFEETLRLAQVAHGPGNPVTLTCLNNLAGSYWVSGRVDKAVPKLEAVLEQFRQKLPADHPATLDKMCNLAQGYQMIGEMGKAIPLFEQTLPLAKESLGIDHPVTLIAVRNLEMAYSDSSNASKPSTVFAECLEWQKEQIAINDSSFAERLFDAARQLSAWRCFPHAEPLWRKCLTIRERAQPYDWSTFNTRSMLGEALLGQKKYEEAGPLLLDGYLGLNEREKSIPPQAAARIAEALDRIIQYFTATNQPSEVEKWRAERAKRVDVP